MKQTRRERRLAKRRTRQESFVEQQTEQKRASSRKNILTWIVVGLILLLTVWWVYGQVTKDRGDRFFYGSVHWHIGIDITVCDERRSLEDLGSRSQHYGGSTLHTHGDNQYHLEGNPGYMERATLGAFFRAIRVPFSDRGIFEYVDGGACPDGDSTFQVLVNGDSIENSMDFVPSDKDEVRVVFG